MIKAVISVVLVIISIALIFKLSILSKAIGLQVSENEFIAGHFKYQVLLLLLALVTAIVLYIINGGVVSRFLSVGNINAAANRVPLLGIKEGESWLSLGLGLSFFIILITALFIYFQVRSIGVSMESLLPLIDWVLLFALSNSIYEELNFRAGIAGALHEVLSPAGLMIVSAVIFGLAHYSGMPNGIVGIFWRVNWDGCS